MKACVKRTQERTRVRLGVYAARKSLQRKCNGVYGLSTDGAGFEPATLVRVHTLSSRTVKVPCTPKASAQVQLKSTRLSAQDCTYIRYGLSAEAYPKAYTRSERTWVVAP